MTISEKLNELAGVGERDDRCSPAFANELRAIAQQSASVPEGTIDIDATNKYHSDLDEARAQVASLADLVRSHGRCS